MDLKKDTENLDAYLGQAQEALMRMKDIGKSYGILGPELRALYHSTSDMIITFKKVVEEEIKE